MKNNDLTILDWVMVLLIIVLLFAVSFLFSAGVTAVVLWIFNSLGFNALTFSWEAAVVIYFLEVFLGSTFS